MSKIRWVFLFLVLPMTSFAERDCLEEAFNIHFHDQWVNTAGFYIGTHGTIPADQCFIHGNESDSQLKENIETRQEYEKHFAKNKTYPTALLYIFHDSTKPAYVSAEELCELVDREVDDRASCRLPREKLSELIKTTVAAEDREKHCLAQLEWLVPKAKACD